MMIMMMLLLMMLMMMEPGSFNDKNNCLGISYNEQTIVSVFNIKFHKHTFKTYRNSFS